VKYFEIAPPYFGNLFAHTNDTFHPVHQ
jgi:hypothetical protein